MVDANLDITCTLANKNKKLTRKQWRIISDGISDLCIKANVSTIYAEALKYVESEEEERARISVPKPSNI